jgi:catechol 2,3-dioxygenase-like lactoylglutathione lyase family enzyme
MGDQSARPPLVRVLGVMIDCPDPERLAAFWTEVLGVEVEDRLGDPAQFVYLAPVQPGGIHLYFQRVPEPKVVKNRVHLDVYADDVELALSRIESLGGRRRDEQPFHDVNDEAHWWRMADPEGNEFCLVFDWPQERAPRQTAG